MTVIVKFEMVEREDGGITIKAQLLFTLIQVFSFTQHP